MSFPASTSCASGPRAAAAPSSISPRSRSFSPFAEGDAQPATGIIGAPQDGAEVAGTVQVKGYVYSGLRVLGVDLIVDGASCGAATYNQRRDDICGPIAEKPANGPNAGFTMNFDARGGSVPLPNRRHTLQVRIRAKILDSGLAHRPEQKWQCEFHTAVEVA